METQKVVLLDPCAGEGKAVLALRKSLHTNNYSVDRQILAVEMEKTRFHSLEKNVQYYDRVAHGDFFHLQTQSEVCNLLYLNPPYDTDKVHKRLEERFMVRAQNLLTQDGLLVFVVPVYALAASAKTLSLGFTNIQCFKFPEPEYSVYKQVVLVARRSQNVFPDTFAERQVLSWAQNPDVLPVLQDEPSVQIPIRGTCAYRSTWEIIGFDESSLKDFLPWTSHRGPVQNICPPMDLAQKFQRVYPVASMPRAAHLSAALAAGVFNGAKVLPDDKGSSFPSVLVKGVFDREYKTIEEKHNKDGEKVAEVQVQQPKLSVTVLDLKSGLFHTIKASSDITAPQELKDMTMGDLLRTYGQSLMRQMLKSCPVLHDPRRDTETEVQGLSRPLYSAQTSAVHTALKLYAQNPNQGVALLGEIGSGKSSVALATALSLGKKRILIMCPPHLLDGWREQIGFVTPQYDVMVLEAISDVKAFAKTTRPTIAILSRERAKLGHGWEAVSGSCPKCGTALQTKDFSIKRECCEVEILRPAERFSKWLAKHALLLSQYIPDSSPVRAFLGHSKGIQKYLKRPAKPFAVEALHLCLLELASMENLPPEIASWLAWIDPSLALGLTRSTFSNLHYGEDTLKKGFLLSLPMGTEFDRWAPPQTWGCATWAVWDKHHAYVQKQATTGDIHYTWSDYGPGTYKGYQQGSEALKQLIVTLTPHMKGYRSKCGERLYQAIPEPKRYPLATYICHKAKNSYDYLIIDESHEYSNDGSAQSHAAQRLVQSKAQAMLLSGSLTNGYADSVFVNMRAISPSFRDTFARDEQSKFIDRYGYWKRVVSETDGKGQIVAYGTNTDRVQQSIRKAGVAPGVMPLFLLEHLLPVSVTLQKEDLRINIPPTSDHVHDVDMLPEQAANYAFLLECLITTIKETKFEAGKAGKLWGAMAHLPSYLDRACSGEYVIAWPENVPEVGGQEICSVPCLDPNILLPKEQWMLDLVQEELEEGRNVMVFGWHQNVLPRLVKILKSAGIDVAYLEAEKVPTGKRQAWIDTHVVKPNKRVLVVNPVTVQTGLNNLVHFHSVLWMENPGVNPVSFRQAIGRVDRIGQQKPTRSHFARYSESSQVDLHGLLLHKVGVSRGVDGLDPEAALRSAGVLDESYSGLSVGRELYKLITGE